MAERSDEIGDLHLGTVVVNVQDMERAVSFWCAALGCQPREERLDPSFMMLVDPEGTHLPLSLQKAEEPPHEPVRLPGRARRDARRGLAVSR